MSIMEAASITRKSAISYIVKTAIVLAALLWLVFASTPIANAGVNEWVSNGPGGAIVNALVISPGYATDKTLFAGTNGSGVYKSTDGGQSWSSSGLPGYILSLAISPNYATDHIVYAGIYGGVCKSTDGGQSWSTSGLTGNDVGSIALSPGYTTDHTLFAGTYGHGIYKSTDEGQNWSACGLSNMYVSAIALSPDFSADTVVFAGTSDGNGIYRSVNGAQDWDQVNSGLSNPYIKSVAVSPDYTSDHTIFTDGFKSTDSGQNWAQIGPLGIDIFSIAMSPVYASDHTVFAGSYDHGVYKSTDEGQNWTQIDSGLENADIPSLAVSSNFTQDSLVFAGTWGSGVYSCPTLVDAVTPIITVTDPANNATVVPAGKTISVTFSENVQTGMAYNIITVRDASNNLVSLNKSISGRILTLDPVSDLAYGGSYTVIVPAGAVKDTANNSLAAQYTFGFTVMDNTAPTVTGTNPLNSATAVARDAIITVTFSENVQTSSAYESITVKDSKNAALPFIKNISGNVLTLDPTTDTASGMLYTVTIPAGAVNDMSNNPLAAQYTFSFTSLADLVSPTVSSTAPTNNATGIAKETSLAITFSEAVQQGTAYNSIAVKDAKNAVVSLTKNISGKVLTLDPAADLAYSSVYTVTIPAAAVKDIASNNLATQYTFSFSTQEDTVPPAVPQGLKSTSTSDTAQLSWTANKETDLAGYNVYRKIKGGLTPAKLNSTTLTATQYQDKTVEVSKTYVYYVTAIDKLSNESTGSTQVEVTITGKTTPGTSGFSDVPADAWYKESVSKLVTQGIAGGYPGGLFRPNQTVSRAEFSKMICLAMGWELEAPDTSSFKDVSADNWAYRYIETAKTHGVIAGYEDGGFKPGKNITRAEIAKIVARTLGLSSASSTLKDISSSWAKDYIGACAKTGIISGYSDSTFKPNNSATRAEAAKMMVGVLNNKK
ncbi:MAG: Ig-like domain-containing protein [Candidatus Aquicultor sp.]